MNASMGVPRRKAKTHRSGETGVAGGRLLPHSRSFMNQPRRILLILALGTLALLGLAGCSSDQKDSSMPWSRPADWENQVPGMSSGTR